MKNPMGCYDVSRYPNREAMLDAVMSVYRVHADLVTPTECGDVAMSDINAPFTAVQIEFRSRMWRLTLVGIVSGLLLLVGLIALLSAASRSSGLAASDPGLQRRRRPLHVWLDRGETHSGLPYWMWKTLPSLFPKEFEGRNDYSPSDSSMKGTPTASHSNCRSAFLVGK